MKIKRDKIYNSLEKIGKKLNIDIIYFAKNSFWVMLRQVFVMITAFALSVLLTRYLTKNEYGQYQLLISILEMFAFFSIPGLASSVLRSVSKGNDGVYVKSLKVRLKYSFFATPFILGLSFYYFYELEYTVSIGLIVLAILFFAFYSFNTWTQLFQGQGDFKTITIARIFFLVSQLLIFYIVLSFFKPNILFLFIAYIVSVSVFNIIMFFYAKKSIRNNYEQKAWEKYGVFLTKINILNIITSKLDYLLVAYLINVEALAVYSIGIKSAKVLQGIFKNLLMTATPKIAKTKVISPKVYILIFILSSIIAILFILILPVFIELAYTNKYSESIYLSQIVIAFLPAFVINNIYEKHIKFYLADKKILLIVNTIFPIINLIVMFILIYFFNLIGLAISFGLRSLIKLIIYKVISIRKQTVG